MKKFGLIGKGISDSASPALFKAAYGGKWNYDLLDGDDFRTLFEKFRNEYQAVNVTSPFKEEALKAADCVTEEAGLCGAANMLTKLPDGRIEADNSDFEGVTLSIMSACAVAGIDVDDEDAFDDYILDRSALIVGCGGAGKAAAAACVTLGFGSTVLMNRDIEKARALEKHLRSFYGDIMDDELTVRPLEELCDAFEEADVVIYAVPETIPQLEELKDRTFPKEKMVFEVSYKKSCLDFLADRASLFSGYNWLYNQAVVAYEKFTGQEPDEEEMKKLLL